MRRWRAPRRRRPPASGWAVADVRRARGPERDVVFYLPFLGRLLQPGSEVPPGGAETQVLLLARELAARGRRACVVTCDVPGLPASVDGIEIVARRPVRTERRLVGKLLDAAAIWRSVASLRTRTLVARGSGFHVAVLAALARVRRRRFVFASAGVLDFDYAGYDARQRNVRLYEWGVRRADQIVVQT